MGAKSREGSLGRYHWRQTLPCSNLNQTIQNLCAKIYWKSKSLSALVIRARQSRNNTSADANFAVRCSTYWYNSSEAIQKVITLEVPDNGHWLVSTLCHQYKLPHQTLRCLFHRCIASPVVVPPHGVWCLAPSKTNISPLNLLRAAFQFVQQPLFESGFSLSRSIFPSLSFRHIF